jgi:dTDP-glucose 4,6-dehydratase
VYGDGLNVRDWLYVRDHCTAIWRIMKHGERGETYTVGGNTEMENIRIVEMICDIMDELLPAVKGRSRRELITFVKDRPGHDRRYAIDCTRLRRELGWSPEESFEAGIRKTIHWYLDHVEWVTRVRSGEYQTWIEAHYGG